MVRISLFLLSFACLMASCTSVREENLINIGKMIINSEIESMQYEDSIRRTHCEGEITPTYVLITEKEQNDEEVFYCAYISEYGEDVDVIAHHKDRLIAICYAQGKRAIRIPSDSCMFLSFDEREWFILYNTRNNNYVAVRSTQNVPPENIRQLNQRNWSTKIQEAMIDTTVPIILQF